MKLDCYVWAIAGLLVSGAQAGDGEVIISREVQPRIATTAPLVADPNPRVVNPGGHAGAMSNELADHDFAGVSSGMAMPQRFLNGSVSTQLHNPTHQGIPSLGASHAGGARASGVSDQVNRSVQQGLRPLQTLGGR